jgi:hypothetical protein
VFCTTDESPYVSGRVYARLSTEVAEILFTPQTPEIGENVFHPNKRGLSLGQPAFGAHALI